MVEPLNPESAMPAAKALLYAQSGGVTAVINATASAVITEARAKKIRVLAARNGHGSICAAACGDAACAAPGLASRITARR